MGVVTASGGVAAANESEATAVRNSPSDQTNIQPKGADLSDRLAIAMLASMEYCSCGGSRNQSLSAASGGWEYGAPYAVRQKPRGVEPEATSVIQL